MRKKIQSQQALTKDENDQRKRAQVGQDWTSDHQLSASIEAFQRATSAPSPALRPGDILTLQRCVGNRAVQRKFICRTLGTSNAEKVIQKSPDNGDLRTASDLFRASNTYQTNPMGQRVHRTLLGLLREREIAYVDLPERTLASSREGLGAIGRPDIAIDVQFRNNIILTSLRLVHEAIHQILQNSYVWEEVVARNLQIDYYTELQTGIALGAENYQAGAGFDLSIETQRNHRRSDHLIDYIIRINTYGSSLEGWWIRENSNRWGGISNRWPHTKARYIQVLLEDTSDRRWNTRLILDILESEDSAFNTLLSWVGGGDQDRGVTMIREGFARLRSLRLPGNFDRIHRLQTQHEGVDFGARR